VLGIAIGDHKVSIERELVRLLICFQSVFKKMLSITLAEEFSD
jgi:hypothetical protein